MAISDHVKLLLDYHAFVQWRISNGGTMLDLRGADLRGVELSVASIGFPMTRSLPAVSAFLAADFTEADLTEGKFIHSFLEGVIFRKAKLRMASMEGAKLAGADLCDADLSGADLRGADLFCARLGGADLRGAHLAGACLWYSDLRGSDMRGATLGWSNLVAARINGATGLEDVIHVGPSQADPQTLTELAASNQLAFLSGIGISEDQVLALRSTIASAVSYQSCFISYSHKDEGFVRYLRTRLQNKGIRVWCAAADLLGGRIIIDEIKQAIRRHDRLLLVLSEHSLRSEWVRSELLEVATESGSAEKFFPVRLCSMETVKSWSAFDPDGGRDLARVVRSYNILDFSCWDAAKSVATSMQVNFHRNLDTMKPFEEVFGKLIRSLQVSQD